MKDKVIKRPYRSYGSYMIKLYDLNNFLDLPASNLWLHAKSQLCSVNCIETGRKTDE